MFRKENQRKLEKEPVNMSYKQFGTINMTKQTFVWSGQPLLFLTSLFSPVQDPPKTQTFAWPSYLFDHLISNSLVVLCYKHLGWMLVWILDIDIINRIQRKSSAPDELDAKKSSNLSAEQGLLTVTEFVRHLWNMPFGVVLSGESP